MVHILRQKIDVNIVYLLVGKEPTADELKKMEGIEYIENINIHQIG